MSKESVCKVVFLETLGLKTNGIITEFVRRKEAGEVGTPIKDNRGKAAPKTKLDKDLIRKHNMSYHPQTNYYKSQNASNKRYLEPHWTITAVWEHDKSMHGDIS